MTRLVTDYLDQSAKKFPDKMAFADSKREVTFTQVRDEAHQIASAILLKKYCRSPVAVFLEKSVECIISFLGVAYSGNFYTPIDVKMPLKRIEKIIKTLQPVLILTDRVHSARAAEFSNPECEILCYEDILSILAQQAFIEQRKRQMIDTDILYVLFTSGSTGVPKGVIIGHRSVIDYTEWVSNTFQIDETHVFGNQAPFYFDNSILDIYQTLKNAASMYIIPEQLFSFPIKLLEFLNEKKVNIIFWVPSALCLVANLKALKKRHVATLQKVLFAGEVMPNKQLNAWREEYETALFANLYGPTEITVDCAAYIVNREFADEEPLPIGTACENTQLFVLDEKDRLILDGRIGELCVRGTSLSYGYYNNQKKTSEVFVQNPLQKAYPEIIYRTGDLVRYNEFGELVYVARKDFQIKHMGHRIELGEIETIVSAFEGIEQNCCLYDVKKAKIVLFYTGNLQTKELTERLKTSLPEYMLPSTKIKLEIMPLNLNGKIDRVRLKEMLCER